MSLFYLACAVLVLLILIVLITICIVWHHPHTFFTPVNAWLSRDGTVTPQQPYFDKDVLGDLYSDYYYAEQHYQAIREEAYALWEQLNHASQNYLDQYHIDLANADTSNWTTLSLRVFGKDNLDYQAQCPVTASLLQRSPKIRSCIFSFMAPGKVIEPHHGPYHGLIRYQLPLTIPDTGQCFLTVGGVHHYWKEGRSVLFDETYLHSASNLTDQCRLVLLMDLPRPYQSELRQLTSEFITTGMGWMGASTERTPFVPDTK
jgi:beta-hydroxylase